MKLRSILLKDPRYEFMTKHMHLSISIILVSFMLTLYVSSSTETIRSLWWCLGRGSLETPNWKSPLGESVQACNLNLRISFANFRYSFIFPNHAHFSLKMSLSNRVQVFLYLLRGTIQDPSGQILLQGVNGTEQLQLALAPPVGHHTKISPVCGF